MLEFWIERIDVNVELLDTQLREAGGALFQGLSTRRGGVMLYIDEKADEVLQKHLVEVARAHDATQMTPEQISAIQRLSTLEKGRQTPPLAVEAYAHISPEIEALAQKLAWLEQEIRDLRGV